MKTEQTICDIKDCGNVASKQQIQVLFTTDQTEGRQVPTYLSIENVDICEACKQKVMRGNCIWGNGAMGMNEFYFRKNPDEDHFDRLRLNEATQKMDKIWAKVPNESHNDLDNAYTVSRAKEETKQLLKQYFG